MSNFDRMFQEIIALHISLNQSKARLLIVGSMGRRMMFLVLAIDHFHPSHTLSSSYAASNLLIANSLLLSCCLLMTRRLTEMVSRRARKQSQL